MGIIHRVYLSEDDGIHLDFETVEGNGDVRYIAAANFVEGRSLLRQPVLPISVAIRGKGQHHVMRYRISVADLEITGVIALDSQTEIQAQNNIFVSDCTGLNISA